ncbi:hypothetical protein IAU60_001107 [Kwoniella sp. DSM 27419]
MVWRTTLVTLSTCFLLGTTFTHWIADHNILWRAPVTADAIGSSIRYYSLLGNAPHAMAWLYAVVGFVALLSTGGRAVKGYRGQGGEVLFDGGSIAIALFPATLPASLPSHPTYPGLATAVRDLATNNVMTAAGRYYSKRPSAAPPSLAVSSASTPVRAPSPERVSPPKRSATPFRELTEEEAMELRDDKAS